MPASTLLLAATLGHSASASSTELVLGGAGGWFAAAPALGAQLDTTLNPTGFLQARADASLFARAPTSTSRRPVAAYLELELTAALSISPQDRLGLSVEGELMVTDRQEQDCSLGHGCRWATTAALGPLVGVPNWAPGLRWSRRTSAGGGLDLGVAPQLAWSYDMGVPLLRIDLDIIRPSGWVFGLETNRFGGLLTVGHQL